MMSVLYRLWHAKLNANMFIDVCVVGDPWRHIMYVVQAIDVLAEYCHVP